jgi:hypothetical protein
MDLQLVNPQATYPKVTLIEPPRLPPAGRRRRPTTRADRFRATAPEDGAVDPVAAPGAPARFHQTRSVLSPVRQLGGVG